MNEWLYRAVRINIGRFLDRNTVLPVERALDVGTGTGFWASFWHGRGIRVVDGSDLIPDAIKRLRAHPAGPGEYFIADISNSTAFAERQPYPIVSCMSVLLHVTEDECFASAIRNLSTVTAYGGYLVIVDAVLTRDSRPRRRASVASSVARPLGDFVQPLKSHGMQLVDVAPAAVLASNPIEGPLVVFWALQMAWWWLVAIDRWLPFMRNVAGRLLLTLDVALASTGFAPGTKVLLFRRVTDPPAL